MKLSSAKVWIPTVIIVAGGIAISQMKFLKPSTDLHQNEKAKLSKETASNYYTCPMHPQIHSDKPGDCPICHMRLVEVKPSSSETHASDTTTPNMGVTVSASESQLKLLAAQKISVEKMDLIIEIPISARFTSSNTIAFQIYESDLYLIRPGQRFELSSPADPTVKIEGKIQAIDSLVDSISRTVRVSGAIDRGEKNIPTEATASGIIQLKREQRLAIPVDAIFYTGSDVLVYKVGDKNELTPTRVKLGERAQSYYEVLSGLQEGDVVSSGANFLIDSESKIRGAGRDQTHH